MPLYNANRPASEKQSSDYNGYVELAIAIVKQSVDDFFYGNISEKTFKRFVRSDWFKVLTDINPDYFERKIIDEKTERDTKKQKKYNSRRSPRVNKRSE